MTDDVELFAGDATRNARVVMSPDAGGRIRQVFVTDTPLLAETADASPTSTGWGSFPMAPWAGRIRNGRFTFMGDDVALDLNHQDGDRGGGDGLTPPAPGTHGDLPEQDRDRHSIHGTTFFRPWTIDAQQATRIEMSCDLDGALGWPFPGVARQAIELAPDHVDVEMTLESVGDAVFPASIGWHPWFAKPDRLEFDPIAMYEQDDAGLPTGRLVDVPPGPWDDCFVNRRAVRLHYDRDHAATVTVSSPAAHWVVFDRPDHATCVEPQTGPPDAPTLRPDVVSPGVALQLTMRIGWT